MRSPESGEKGVDANMMSVQDESHFVDWLGRRGEKMTNMTVSSLGRHKNIICLPGFFVFCDRADMEVDCGTVPVQLVQQKQRTLGRCRVR